MKKILTDKRWLAASCIAIGVAFALFCVWFWNVVIARIYRAGADAAVAEMSEIIQREVLSKGQLKVAIQTKDGPKQVLLVVPQSQQFESEKTEQQP